MAIELQHLLETRQELAALEERNRLARDLHDSVKQQVFAAVMQVGAAQAMLPEEMTGVQTPLAESRRLVQQAQQELTILIHELRPAALKGKGLTAALREYVSKWSRQNNITAGFQTRAERPLPLAVEQAIFRVVQEALANVARHSRATRADLHLTWQEDGITLVITDNGQGFDPAAAGKEGLGRQSIRERVEALGGQLWIESQPGAGTRVTAHLPQAQRSPANSP